METLNIMISGSRSIKNEGELRKIIQADLCNLNQKYRNKQIFFIHGGARGVDSIGAEIAYELGFELDEYIPDWEGQGDKAGFIRNRIMVKKADLCLFYWNGKSNGTRHAIEEAQIEGKKFLITIVE